jgi:hypothetical protein
MDRLEQRIGPEGRRMFERFLKQVNRLQQQQQGVIDNEDEGAGISQAACATPTRAHAYSQRRIGLIALLLGYSDAHIGGSPPTNVPQFGHAKTQSTPFGKDARRAHCDASGG